jgi:peptide/nickel transport system permease protein
MHYLPIRVITVIFFLFNVLPGDPARMMLDQNENSEQLALIKKKYGFDKPIATQYLYYINDLSPLSLHSKKRLHVFERRKIQCSTLFSFSI